MADAMITALQRLSIWLALLAFPFTGSAHRLDEYLQATLVVIEPDSIKLQINLTPGVAVAPPVLALIDGDRDGLFSTNEAVAYAELLKRDLTLRLDEHLLQLRLTPPDFPPPDELRIGWGIIRLEYTATPERFAAGTHELVFENRHQTNLSVYLVNAALPKSNSISITRQTRNENQSTARIEFTFQPPAADRSIAKSLVSLLSVTLIVLGAGAAIWWKRGRNSKTVS